MRPALILLCAALLAPEPARGEVDVTGTWEARFEGTVEGRGTRQTDTFVLELRQSGTTVTGRVRTSGSTLELVLEGEVRGGSFTYTARARLSPGCEVELRAETTLEADGSRWSGGQTQSTCEGKAVGRVAAARR